MASHLLKRRDVLSGALATSVTLLSQSAVAQEQSSAEDSSRKKGWIDERRAPKGKGLIDWQIIGDQVVYGPESCPPYPNHFYQVIINKQQDAEIRYLIWNKISPQGTGAIERVCVNDEGDYAEGKTAHYVDFPTRTVTIAFCSWGKFTLEATLIWQDTVTKANHLERKSIPIDYKKPPAKGAESAQN